MNWDRYVKEAKRTQPSDEQYDKARAMLMIGDHKHLRHLLGVISALAAVRMTLGKLKKLIFAGKSVTFYEHEQHDHFLWRALTRLDLEHIGAKLATPEGIAILHGAVGFADEALEVLDLVPPWLTQQSAEWMQEKTAEEGGDTLWYQAILYDALGLNLPAMCAGNAAKLAARWPVSFDPENVVSRDHALESGAMMEAIRLEKRAEIDELIQEEVNEAVQVFAKGLVVPGDTLAIVVKAPFKMMERIISAVRARPKIFPFKIMVFPSECEIDIADPYIADLVSNLSNRITHALAERDEARSELEAVRLERDMANVEIARLEALLKEREAMDKPPEFHSGTDFIPPGLTITIPNDYVLPKKVVDDMSALMEAAKGTLKGTLVLPGLVKLRNEREEIGSTTAPSRYNKPGRMECLDEIRVALGEKGFQSWLIGTIIKYAYRSGAKVGDIEKEMFYRQLLEHVAEMPGVADPRSSRPDWKPAAIPLDDTDEGEAIMQQYFPELR